MRCLYCRPGETSPDEVSEGLLGFDEIVGFVRELKGHFGLAKVRITGGEPLMRDGLNELVRMLAREDIPDLALTTNGQQLAEQAEALRSAGLDRVNISLDSLDAATYRKLTRGGDLTRTLEGIDAARRMGFSPVKLNMVVLRGINDREVTDLARFGLERGCPVRFLEVMPIGVAAEHYDRWFVPAAEVAKRLSEAFELRPLPREPGASSRNVLARDGRGHTGILGFISPCSRPFCADCQRLRLTSTGMLLGCLARSEGVDIRPLLKEHPAESDGRLVQAVGEAFRLKRGGRDFGDQKHMVSIGG